ncbi:hypothetical protein [Hoeflea poritis]|uniref:Uncharacterized protein n=1 Tax=Hoeflea poritis TaxID=2993659 RepID=A0ABT4VS11_9HYPH|nr:hypothetical protein [Hoeflea poritis]MDA4847503.1 hypothetical protein [Hoeflea poritis]
MAGTGQNLAKKDVEASDQAAESLTTLLLKLQLELAEVAQLIEAAEVVLCRVHGDGKHVNPEDLPVIQGMDLAIQKTKGLSDFLAKLAGDTPQDLLIDTTTALNVLKLSEMQQRLRPYPVKDGGSRHDAGDTEMF